MNIKNFPTTPVIPIDPKRKIEGNTRSQASSDRDSDGRRDRESETKRHLTQQEFDDAMKVLQDLPGLKSNNLTIKVETKPDCRVILIVDSEGKVVRRLSENELWLSTRDKDRQTGTILDKAM